MRHIHTASYWLWFGGIRCEEITRQSARTMLKWLGKTGHKLPSILCFKQLWIEIHKTRILLGDLECNRIEVRISYLLSNRLPPGVCIDELDGETHSKAMSMITTSIIT